MKIVKPGYPVSDQRGIASLLSVVFFILISSIIMVGFTRLAMLEGRQSVEDSLSKAAMAAAYSGVNDAKRAILYCSQFAVRPVECNNLNDTSCPGFSANSSLRAKLGLIHDPVTNSIQVGGDPALNERYTCTTVTEDTLTVKGSLVEGSNDEGTTLIPLRGIGNFDTVVISWQTRLPSSTLSGLNYGNDSDNASYRDPESFSSFFRADQNWPALLGAHIMSQPGASISYPADGSVVGINQKRFLFFPGATGGSSIVDANAAPGQVSRQLIQCNATTGYKPISDEGSYVCQVTIRGLGALPGARYLQLTSLYRSTDYVVELLSGATSVRFDNVNPQIDSTGAVENVFRRVQVGVRHEGTNFGGRNPILPNAIDTGAGLCKDMTIGAPSFIDNCSSTLGAGAANLFNGADAVLGGFCAINECPPSGSGDDGSDATLGPPANFTQNIFNISNNADADVAGCTWTISDGTVIKNQYCLKDDKFTHRFPTTPYPPKTKYTVNLRVVLKNGSTASYTGEFWMPRR